EHSSPSADNASSNCAQQQTDHDVEERLAKQDVGDAALRAAYAAGDRAGERTAMAATINGTSGIHLNEGVRPQDGQQDDGETECNPSPHAFCQRGAVQRHLTREMVSSPSPTWWRSRVRRTRPRCWARLPAAPATTRI